MPVELNTTYGRLITVAKLATEHGRTRWVCRCLCGTPLLIVRGDQLLTGRARSCGCIRKTRSGLSTSPTYITWAAMRRRCSDVRHPRYADYGGRGVQVCARWDDPVTGFEAFLADVGLRPEGKTLDRVDVDRGYEPGNVKWSTLQEQRWNRRDMKKLAVEREEAMSEQAYWDELEQSFLADIASDEP